MYAIRKLAVIGAALPLVALAACDVPASGTGDTGSSSSSGSHSLTYKVYGSAKHADVTYTKSADLDTSQTNGSTLPWTKSIKLSDDDTTFSVFTINAQNKGGGVIKCSIAVDGKVVKRNVSKGQYAIVDCTYTFK